MEIPLTVSRGTAESGDYSVSGLTNGKVAFGASDKSKSFTVSAAQDADCANETVNLSFGTLPAGVNRASPSRATLTINDDDDPDRPPCTTTPTVTVTPDNACDVYDTDGNGKIDGLEVTTAISDYFDDKIDRPVVNKVIECYYSDSPPPGQALDLNVNPVSGGFEATWKAPSGGGPHTYYEVRHKLSSASWPDDSGDDNGTSLSKTFSVSPGTYDARVRACNPVKCGRWSTVRVRVSITPVCSPTFGNQSVSDRSWRQGTRIASFTLPAASGTNCSLTYTLSRALPNGVTLDSRTREVSGTPAAAMTRTQYTWRARDAGGAEATLTFHITVTAPPGNRPPKVVLPRIAARTLTVGGGSVTIGLLDKFSDPDGDTLRYTARSSMPSVATVPAKVSGGNLTVTPAGSGATTVTVTAYDRSVGGLSASQRFTVTVSNPSPTNNPPVVAVQIAAQSLTVGGGPTIIELSDKFSDPDNDKLRYTASWSNSGVATASVSGNNLTISPVGTGTAQVTVWAHDRPAGDSDRLSVSQRFNVTALEKPPAPTNLVATASGITTIDLTWRSATTGIARHRVQYTTNPNDPLSWTTMQPYVTSTMYPATGLQPDTTYHFRVFANGDGNTYAPIWSDVSNTDSAQTKKPIPVPPSVISNESGDGFISLDWGDVTYAEDYEVQQWVGSSSNPGFYTLPYGQYNIRFSGSSARITGLINGATYTHRIRSKNSSGDSQTWTRIDTVVPLVALAITDLVPLPQRRAKLVWDTPISHNPSNMSLTIQIQYIVPPNNLITEEFQPSNDANHIFDLDNINGRPNNVKKSLADADSFWVSILVRANNAVAESNHIGMIDTPVRSISGNDSQVTIKWKPPVGTQDVFIRHKRLGTSAGGFDHTTEEWRLDSQSYPGTPGRFVTDLTPADGSITLAQLEPRSIHAVQLYYRNANTVIYSARDVFVWPSSGFPTESFRVGTFPFFGHWRNGQYTYAVCDETFSPPDQRSSWVALIDHAFGSWQRAAPHLVSIMRESSSQNSNCKVDSRPITSEVPMTIIDALYNERNEVYMVDSDSLGTVNPFLPLHQFFYSCVRGDTACVISPRYLQPIKAPGQALDDGTVDVLVSNNVLLNLARGEVTRPGYSNVQFNTCLPAKDAGDEDKIAGTTNGPDEGWFVYQLMVHEAGHALGLSEFSWLTPTSRAVAHAHITDSVMNYDSSTGVTEPDCSPHPFDIMALHTLYQTIRP